MFSTDRGPSEYVYRLEAGPSRAGKTWDQSDWTPSSVVGSQAGKPGPEALYRSHRRSVGPNSVSAGIGGQGRSHPSHRLGAGGPYRSGTSPAVVSPPCGTRFGVSTVVVPATSAVTTTTAAISTVLQHRRCRASISMSPVPAAGDWVPSCSPPFCGSSRRIRLLPGQGVRAPAPRAFPSALSTLCRRRPPGSI